MAAVRRTRVFRSGNSRAVRLPADWPIEVGEELLLREEGGRFLLQRDPGADPLLELHGACPGLRPLAPGELEARALPWQLLDRARD